MVTKHEKRKARYVSHKLNELCDTRGTLGEHANTYANRFAGEYDRMSPKERAQADAESKHFPF
jgi:hypothetical protein